MDYPLYTIINSHNPIGHIISKRLAEKGNTVVYLTDNESEGFAIVAEEPRIRYRYCSPTHQPSISDELVWIERQLAIITSIVVIVEAEDIDQDCMPLAPELFNRFIQRTEDPHIEMCVTYVIVPSDENSSPETLKFLHLKLCQLAHNNTRKNETKINYIILSSANKKKLYQLDEMAKITSDLIGYLSSQQATAIRHQAFYIENPSNV